MPDIARSVARLGSSKPLTFLVLWAATAALGLAWAASTPMAASPDEPAHIIKAAAVVRGEWIGEPTDRPGFTKVEVPAGVAAAWNWTCTAYEESTPASCQGTFRDGSELVAAKTSAGLYNPGPNTERVICPSATHNNRLELWMNHIISPAGLLGTQTPLTLDAFDLQTRQGEYRFEVSRAPLGSCGG